MKIQIKHKDTGKILLDEFAEKLKEKIKDYLKSELKIIKDIEKEWKDENLENKKTHFGISYPRIYSNQYYAFVELKNFWKEIDTLLKEMKE